jgi:hypothetical protein
MADTRLFSRLKRLFSTDVVIRNVGGNQIKVIDSDRIQSNPEIATNSLTDRFTRLYRPNYATVANPLLNYQTLRIQLYSDYEVMDTDAIVASALDILSDESTLKNESGEVLHIKSPDENLQKVLYNLFYDVLNIEFNLWSWIRNMAKYGDFYLKLDIAERYGVYNVKPFSAYDIIREEGQDPQNPSYVRFKYAPGSLGQYNYNEPAEQTFENYEMAHFRLLADYNYLPYGRSYLEPGRKVYKQMVLMEDAALIHRIMRAPEKRIYYINVGNIPPNEVEAFMQKTISKMQKTPYVDQQTGEYNLKFNMQNMTEDFYIPVRGNDTSTKIDTTPGLQYDGMEDVAYLRDKLFAALKVPKAFLGYDENLEGKSTLAAQDIRFARTIERIQRIVLSELTKIALVHLYAQGYKDSSLTNFELLLTTPSIIYDQERIALWKEKADLAAQLIDNKLASSDWVFENIFHFSEDEYNGYRNQMLEDAKRKFRVGQIENEGNDPVESGKSFGTPHDLASLYGKGRYDGVPAGYDEDKEPVGRPQEKVSNRNTQDDNFGKDRLGSKGMKDVGMDVKIKQDFKGASPLALETTTGKVYNSMKNMFSKKEIIFEQKEIKKPSLLDEKNLRNID